jgi:hypothetical protein
LEERAPDAQPLVVTDTDTAHWTTETSTSTAPATTVSITSKRADIRGQATCTDIVSSWRVHHFYFDSGSNYRGRRENRYGILGGADSNLTMLTCNEVLPIVTVTAPTPTKTSTKYTYAYSVSLKPLPFADQY